MLVLSELESMAARQQREIAQQRRLLEQREARLAVLRGAQVSLVVSHRFHPPLPPPPLFFRRVARTREKNALRGSQLPLLCVYYTTSENYIDQSANREGGRKNVPANLENVKLTRPVCRKPLYWVFVPFRDTIPRFLLSAFLFPNIPLRKLLTIADGISHSQV